MELSEGSLPFNQGQMPVCRSPASVGRHPLKITNAPIIFASAYFLHNVIHDWDANSWYET